ncbi:hypothetical protein BLNAU_1023 [Blattamonas nauphoetae]|uniref:Uncharacterized protein n=1 Tax=Blattamonas nauphoetae TaxID=2049346 RepID=A0ABQ9YJK8_9EUKA|nr:hypothetical protein BLNAU_1023 [Blattamonas nauphoetae]
MLRTEGIEDVIDQKLRNDKTKYFGGRIVDNSIGWNNLQGMNVPQLCRLVRTAPFGMQCVDGWIVTIGGGTGRFCSSSQ